MAVEWTLDLAGRQSCQVIAKLLRPDAITDWAAGGGEPAVLFHIIERGIVEVHEGLQHVVSPIEIGDIGRASTLDWSHVPVNLELQVRNVRRSKVQYPRVAAGT
jgi:hypothetical protein